MKMVTYKAKNNCFSSERAQIYGECLERIQEKHGGEVQTSVVVDIARDEASPLHDYFEWDNTKAAEKHRLWQARQLIDHITVVIEDPDTHEEIEQEAYINVILEDEKEQPEEGEGEIQKPKKYHRTYMPIEYVLADDVLRQQVLGSAMGQVLHWRNKYSAYQELAQIVRAIDTTKAQLEDKGVSISSSEEE